MHRVRAGGIALLLLGASAAGTTGRSLTHAASGDTSIYYAQALLWPVQSGATPLWAASNIPGGSLAILSGQGGNLKYILHARYLQPGQRYSAYIGGVACGSPGHAVVGAAHTSKYTGTTIHNNLGHQQASPSGTITLRGTLDVAMVPTLGMIPNRVVGQQYVLAIHVQPDSSSGSSHAPAYCGNIEPPRAVIPLRPVGSSKASGIAMVGQSGSIWWESSNTLWSGSASGPATEVVVFAQGLTPTMAHQEHIYQGSCGDRGARVEYPLADIEADSAGAGVAGTLLNTTADILQAAGSGHDGSNPRVGRLSIAVQGSDQAPLTCGNVP